MKSLTTRMSAFITVLAIVASLLAGSGIILNIASQAEAAEESHGLKYFYNQVSGNERADKFYKAFETLENNGTFKNGKLEYNLVENEVTTSKDVQAYVSTGDAKMVQAYGAGRDAYFMDHPDLFYVDVFGTSISAGSHDGDYVAYLDSSRVSTLYMGGLNTKSAVESAITVYENKLTEIVNGAPKGTVEDKIKYVNKYIVDHTEYSYGTSLKDGKYVDGVEAPYINTAYGALVYGKAVCGGYSNAFKAVMDRLEIPCVCVQGYVLSNGSSTYQPHMWNAVQVEGMWYAVDVTWNDTTNKTEEWLLVGQKSISSTHIEDPEVSSSGFELRYPALKPYDFGKDVDENGMDIKGKYEDSEDDTGKLLTLTVSYEGKGAKALEKEGKYLAYRNGQIDEDGKIIWYDWIDIVKATEVFAGGAFSYNDKETYAYLHAGMEYVQFALIDYAPDMSKGATDASGNEFFWLYNEENLTDDHIIGGISEPYKNEGFESYIPAPGGIPTPHNTAALPVDKSIDVKVTYNEKLVLAEDKEIGDIDIDFYTTRGNDTVKEHAKVSNVHWDGESTVTFTFTPSRMFIHNKTLYYMYPTNLIGEKSKKVPMPITYSFTGDTVVCNKILPDHRLYMSVYGTPNILDDSDLSVTDFQDENGNYYAESQRSQLLLVASKPSAEKEEKMDEVLKNDMNVKDEDIVTSATYEINLQMCGIIPKIPNNSFVRVSFGFPEGYSPDDEGTTFKIYHYKTDEEGNIIGVEEIPVIVTKYGLIAEMAHFSPFKIVQLKNTSAAVTESNAKSIYATVAGGGTVLTEDNKSGIYSLTGDSVTYSVTANEGFQVSSILLNGTAVDLNKVVNGKLTFNKSELEDTNTLEVSFVTEESVLSYEEKGFTVITVSQMIEAPEPIRSEETNPNPEEGTGKTINVGAIVGGVVGGVVGVLVIAGVVVAVLLWKKKNTKKDDKKSKTKAKSTKKAETKPKTKAKK